MNEFWVLAGEIFNLKEDMSVYLVSQSMYYVAMYVFTVGPPVTVSMERDRINLAKGTRRNIVKTVNLE